MDALMAAVRGATKEERDRARAALTRQRRAAHYRQLIGGAVTGEDWREALRHSCDYLEAVADELPALDVRGLAETVTKLADERNQT